MTVLTRDILVEGLREIGFEWLANFNVHAEFLRLVSKKKFSIKTPYPPLLEDGRIAYSHTVF